ncbi:MAG: lysophospholipid acyltransferase family protein [Anaeromyxobacter sp.]
MAARTSRKKAPRTRAARGRAKAAPPRAVLGNDPFARGAAPRAPAQPPTPPLEPHPPPRAPAPEPAAGTGQAYARGSTGSPGTDEARERLVEVERRVDAALDGVEGRLMELAERAGLRQARAELGETLSRLLPQLQARLGAALDLLKMVEPPSRLDRHGMDPRLVERALPLVEFLCSTWWRLRIQGLEQVPSRGPALVVANHAGLVPWDALVLRHALRRDHPAHRELRPLLDDRECDRPLVGGLAIRLGAVRATPEAAEQVLRGGDVLGVFPEGSAAARKLWRDRYRIQRFGRGGFVKLALRTGATIVPCAVVGSEEASPGIARTGWLAELLGLPLLSASPALRFGPAALLPLPSRWSLRFGEPFETRSLGPAAAEHQPTVNALAERVRASLQAMLDEDVAARGSVFL